MEKGKVNNHAIFCPVNRRKLMVVKNAREPIVEICEKGNEENYDMVTRCPTCKCYVGIKM